MAVRIRPESLPNWEECPVFSHPPILFIYLRSQWDELPPNLSLVSKPVPCAGFYFQFPISVFSSLWFLVMLFLMLPVSSWWLLAGESAIRGWVGTSNAHLEPASITRTNNSLAWHWIQSLPPFLIPTHPKLKTTRPSDTKVGWVLSSYFTLVPFWKGFMFRHCLSGAHMDFFFKGKKWK